jgi:hypothetical protein
MDASAIQNKSKELDYARLSLPRALRAIRYANVRFGILPPQSRFRGNDDRELCTSGKLVLDQ